MAKAQALKSNTPSGTVMVTGGAGYIGSHCVKQLLAGGRRVLVVDNLSTGYEKLVKSPDFIEADTADAEAMVKLMRDYQVSAVMHFSAFAYVGESVTNPEKYYRNNIYGTLQLLSAMREAGVKQFIFSSTCASYGDPQYLPLDEKHPLNPINPYGYTKRVVEEMLKDFSSAYGLRYVALRYFNAAGADPEGELGECHDPETHLIPLVLQVASGRRPHITVFGDDYQTPDGTCIRDYIHILDIAQAHIKALEFLEAGNASDIFNIGTGNGNSVKQIIEMCEQVSGKKIAIEMGERRPGDPPALVASNEKIKTVLGWNPDYPDLKPIIETAWAWEQKEAGLVHSH
ncbi:MAG: UDP-glucose 4-epimerase GalE [Vampirovibrionales bacterium]|nr:UDP-glucose 4-epimerase GalE [Vampirovibrionales bacterium]